MDKFCWKENEITIAKSQCDLCENQIMEDCSRCAKYEVKPKGVLNNTVKCPCFSRKGRVRL